MIGSFWNLCRACPSMPVDKLHSEYRSTYRWHEYTGPRQEVVRRPPQPTGGNGSGKCQAAMMCQGSEEEANTGQDGSGSPSAAVGSNLEPAMPRKKKHPELAYKTHEFLGMSDGGSDDSLDSTVSFDRARMRASFPPPVPPTQKTNKPRISTEYRLQFAWPRAAEILARKAEEARNAAAASAPPRKSLSMGAIRPTSHSVPVHKKRSEEPEGAPELEPLVGSEDAHDGSTNLQLEVGELRGEEKIQEESLSKEEKPRRRKEFKTEYKKRFRPFSQYEYTEGRFMKRKEGDVIDTAVPDIPLTVPLRDLSLQSGDSWYHEVLELRKKAGEYKHRGWGTELVPQHIAELYNKQMALWDQVSRRSSLSALSLASTSPRSITKEEKERENSKKSSPTKSLMSNRMMTAIRAEDRVDTLEKKKMDSDKKEVPRSRKEFLIRHHLERTTGAVDGALLPSPTREKLEPVIPRRKEEDVAIKSPPKSSPKSSPRSARSQSVGPISENRSSPKRQPRASGVPPSGTQNFSSAKTHPNGPIHSERRPRPTSLSTAPSRSKSSSLAIRNEEGKSHHAMKSKHNLPTASSGKTLVNGVQNAGKVKGDRNKPVTEKKNTNASDEIDNPSTQQGASEDITLKPKPPASSGPNEDIPASSAEESSQVTPTVAMVEQSSTTEQPTAMVDEICEQIVKSPPEPTRVKSPEQILMRSPEPVNWTVPLDTGKTFTVTQNVREGEVSRPLSEVKQLGNPLMEHDPTESGMQNEQNMMSSGRTDADHDPVAGGKSPSSDPMTTSMMGTSSAVNGLEDKSEDSQASQEVKSTVTPQHASLSSAGKQQPSPCEKSVAGTTLKCLDDPIFDSSSAYPVGGEPSSIKPEFSSGSPYHVLEGPSDVGDITLAASRPSSTPYRILEAPDTTIETSPTKSATIMSPSSSRSMASDVLEKARTRFDKFWGKTKDSEKEGNV